MVFRRGLANWHTREAQALLALKYRVEQGHWTGPDDHARTPFTAEPLPLKRMLGALHLDNLADFLETAAEASPETVEQVRTQACDALITGDVAALKVTGIDREYSLKNHLAAFDRNESYIFMNDKGTIEFRKPERNDAGTEPAGQIAEILDKS